MKFEAFDDSEWSNMTRSVENVAALTGCIGDVWESLQQKAAKTRAGWGLEITPSVSTSFAIKTPFGEAVAHLDREADGKVAVGRYRIFKNRIGTDGEPGFVEVWAFRISHDGTLWYGDNDAEGYNIYHGTDANWAARLAASICLAIASPVR